MGRAGVTQSISVFSGKFCGSPTGSPNMSRKMDWVRSSRWARVGLVLGAGVQIVQAPDEKQVSDLLNDLQGVEMPPDQNASQMRSILAFQFPVITR